MPRFDASRWRRTERARWRARLASSAAKRRRTWRCSRGRFEGRGEEGGALVECVRALMRPDCAHATGAARRTCTRAGASRRRPGQNAFSQAHSGACKLRRVHRRPTRRADALQPSMSWLSPRLRPRLLASRTALSISPQMAGVSSGCDPGPSLSSTWGERPGVVSDGKERPRRRQGCRLEGLKVWVVPRGWVGLLAANGGGAPNILQELLIGLNRFAGRQPAVGKEVCEDTARHHGEPAATRQSTVNDVFGDLIRVHRTQNRGAAPFPSRAVTHAHAFAGHAFAWVHKQCRHVGRPVKILGDVLRRCGSAVALGEGWGGGESRSEWKQMWPSFGGAGTGGLESVQNQDLNGNRRSGVVIFAQKYHLCNFLSYGC